MQYGGMFGAPGEPLTSVEIGIARPVFLESIDYSLVRVVVSSVVAAPTTLGNNIRTRTRTMPNWVLIHELMHIWQYQTQGSSYISSSACAQVMATIASGDRNAAYDYTPGRRSLSDYNAEQQAHIVEDVFKNPSLASNEDYQRYMRQVRTARPRMTDQERYNEAMFGTPGSGQRSIPPPAPGTELSGTAPIFRVEF
jgi:hypothetical protein